MVDVLDMKVLKLNKNYLPLGVITAREAFTKLSNKRAEIVTVEDGSYFNYDISSWAELSELKKELESFHEHDDWFDLSIMTLQVPRIIRCLYYDKDPHIGVKFNRRNVFARDNYTCQYCGKKFKTKQLTWDHVIPKSRNGVSAWNNLVCACFKCNSKKSNKTPKEANMKLIRKPYKPKYSPVFRTHISNVKYSSWKKFVSEVYWNCELEG